MKKNWLLFLSFLFACNGFVQAQTTVTIPADNHEDASTRFPYGTAWGFERTAMIYTSSEIGTTGQITNIGFYLDSSGAQGDAVSVKIYMKLVTADTFPTAGTKVKNEEISATLVDSETIDKSVFNPWGIWITRTLTTPFNYTGGTKNLEIIIETNAGTQNEGFGAKKFRWSQPADSSAQIWNGNTVPTGNGKILPVRPNIQLIFVNTKPTITSIPAAACVGDVVTINGTNFSGIVAVKFNGVDATNYSVLNSTTITAVVPNSPSNATVTVTNPAGTGSSTPLLFTIRNLPNQVVVTGTGAFCNSTTISASGAVSGETIYYQGTNSNGTSTTTPSTSQIVNSSGIYYFRIFNGTCWGNEGSVDVTIDNVPGAVSISAPAGPYCGSTIITASGGSGGTIYFQGTNPSGTSTATPSTSQVILASGTYYFNAKNSCTTFGPSGSINITINPIPGAITVTGGGVQCGNTILNASGGAGGTIYYQGTTTGGTSTTMGGATSPVIAVNGTYYFRSLSAAGCWGPEVATNVSFAAGIAFASLPMDRNICAGGSTTFSVTVSPPATPVSYQWRIGSTNLNNIAGNISGVFTNTLTISNAMLSNNAVDYNCVVSDACGYITSNYVRLTVNPAAVAPTAQPTSLTFLTGSTSAVGSFMLSPDAMGYLVIRTSVNTQPSSPVNGTTYITGNTYYSGGVIEYVGPNNLFNSAFLTQNTTYYYWIYGYNINNCGTTPLYLKPSPLTGTITTGTTTSCGSPAPAPLYWFGQGSLISGSTNSTNFNDSSNWSRSPGSYVFSPFAPDKCTDVSIVVQSRGTFSVDFTDPVILLTADGDVHDLVYSCNKGYQIFGGTPSTYPSISMLSTQNHKLQVFGNASIDLGDNVGNFANIGENNMTGTGVIDFKADVKIGIANNTFGRSVFQGNSNSRIIFRGALTLGKTASIKPASAPGIAEFDGIASQSVIWNNSLDSVNFKNVVIGNIYSPIIRLKGTVKPDNIFGNLTINNSATLDLDTAQWNRQTGGGTFTMNGTSSLKLARASSLKIRGQGITVSGSNFPGGFSTTFTPGSTVEYYSVANIDQTVYNTPLYGNLTLTNGTGLGSTIKKLMFDMTGITGNLTINPYATFNIGVYKANRSSTGGTFSMGSNGILVLNGTSGGAGTNNNFPANFSTYSFQPTSNTVYSGIAPQGIFGGVDYGHLNLNGTSTITAPPGNLTVKGDLNKLQTTCTFVHNSGTVIFDGSAAQSYNSVPPTMDFYNLTNNNPSGSSINSDLSVSNKLSFGSSSKLNLGVGNITLKSTAVNTAYVGVIPSTASLNYLSSGLFVVERFIATGTGANPNHGKSWQLLAIPTTGSSYYNGQSIKEAWQEGATATNVSSPSPGTAGNLFQGYGTMLTSDVAGAASQPTPGFDAYTPLGPSIKVFNFATNSYVGPSNTGVPIYNPKGYFVFVRGDRNVYAFNQPATPTILRTKGRLFSATYLPPATAVSLNAFESVGNPYASPIDFRLVQKTNLANVFQVWDPRLGGGYNYGAFQTLTADLAGNYHVTPGGGSYGTAGSVHNFIESGQAFLVQTTIGNNGSISFSEAVKGDTASSLFTTPAHAPQLETSLRTTVYSVNGGQSLLDGVLSEFGNYSNAINEWDARKSTNTGENLSIRTGGLLLAVERRQNIAGPDTIFLNFTGVRAQPYRFGFDAINLNTAGLQAYLEDAYLHTSSPLNMNGNTLLDFTVANVAGSYAADRFRIVFATAKALPVTITAVKAYRQDKNINVEWKVENELNIKNYTVEKSADGIHFSILAVTPPAGITNSPVSYQVIDNEPVTGYNYYRIRSNDQDGKTSLTQVVRALMGTVKEGISIYPNPVNGGTIHLHFVNEPGGNYVIRLLNKTGQIIMNREIARTEGSSTELIKWSFNLAHGMYQLEVTKPDGSVKTINMIY